MIKEANKARSDNEKRLRNDLKQEFKEEIGGLKSLVQQLLENQSPQ